MFQAQNASSAPPTFAELQHPHNYSCTSGTTCAVTLTTGLSNGSLLTIQTYQTSPTIVTSASAGGTVTPCYGSIRGSSNIGYQSLSYIASTTATAGPITFTFAVSTGGGTSVQLREFSTGGGTPVIDACQSSLNAVSSPFNGETLTLSGTDVLVQAAGTDFASVTAVASPYDTNADFDGTTSGGGWARRLNSSVTTPPSWTATGSGNAATIGAGFGFSIAACQDVALTDFSTGTATNNVDATTLNSSTFGGIGSWGSASGSPASAETYQTAAHFNLVNTSTCDGHKTGSGTLGMKFDTNASTAYYFPYTFAPNGPTNNIFTIMSAGFWFVPHIDTSDTGFYSMNSIEDGGGVDFISTHVHSGEFYMEAPSFSGQSSALSCTGSSCNGNNNFSYTKDHQYWITYQFNKYVANGTSTSSLTIGTGSKTFTTQAGLGYTNGQLIMANNSGTNWMAGTVSSYSGTTLTISVTMTGGSGTLASWTFTGTMHTMSVYDTDGSTLLASMKKPAFITTPSNPDSFHLGRIGDSGGPAGSYIYVSNVKISYAGTFPLLP